MLNEITKLDVQNYRTDELILEILKRVCVFKRWPIGHAYVVQRSDEEALLKSTGVWHSEATGEDFEEFKKISEEYVFYPGEGLPGQAYEKQSVQTIYDEGCECPSSGTCENCQCARGICFSDQGRPRSPLGTRVF